MSGNKLLEVVQYHELYRQLSAQYTFLLWRVSLRVRFELSIYVLSIGFVSFCEYSRYGKHFPLDIPWQPYPCSITFLNIDSSNEPDLKVSSLELEQALVSLTQMFGSCENS